DAQNRMSFGGGSQEAQIDHIDQRTYHIETQLHGSPNNDVVRQSRPQFAYTGEAPLIVGPFTLAPWLYSERNVKSLSALTFFPIGVRTYALERAPSTSRPGQLPKSDLGIVLKATDAQGDTTLWYDPCTYVVDAYVSSGSEPLL